MVEGQADEPSPPAPDTARAAELLGKHVLIGLTYCNADGTPARQEQLHGHVSRVAADVIGIRLSGSGAEFTVPPDLEAFQPAGPGVYRLSATGEEVENPDYLVSWTITAPAEDPRRFEERPRSLWDAVRRRLPWFR